MESTGEVDVGGELGGEGGWETREEVEVEEEEEEEALAAAAAAAAEELAIVEDGDGGGDLVDCGGEGRLAL